MKVSFLSFLTVLPWLLVTGSAGADVLLGAQLGKQYLGIKQTDPTGATHEDTAASNASLGLIIGIGQPGGGSRITAEWDGFGIGSDVDVNLLNVSYNHFLPALTSSDAMRLRPFVGAELGYGWLSVDAPPAFNGGDDSGVLVGARAGLNLAITDRAEVEVGARYSAVNLDARLGSRVPGVNAAHYEVENNKGWWIGFNVGL